MDSGAQANLVYEDFEPSTEEIHEKDCDTILFNLPEFKKYQLRVQLTLANILRVTGNRPIADKKWKRFGKEIPVPPNCDVLKISAKFEGGILYIRLPKLIVQEENLDTKLAPPPEKPADDGLPQAQNTTPQDNVPSPKEEPSAIETRKEPRDAKTGDQDGAEKETSIARDDRGDDRQKGVGKEDKPAETSIQKYKPKMPRRIRNAVLVAILALSLGIYIAKLVKSCKINVICT